MTPKKEEVLLDAIRNKYPHQADSLEAYFWRGWKFIGHGANDSIDIKFKSEVAYIRTDGTFRY